MKDGSIMNDLYLTDYIFTLFLQLDKVVEKHKESHRRILEQLLMVEKSHRQIILELEEEKRKHKEYMEKNDEFIHLLEQECER